MHSVFYKMAAIASIGLVIMLTVTILLFSMVEATDTQVTISTANYPVMNGGILTVRCQAWNVQDHFTVNMFRTINTRTEQITNGKDILPSAGRNVFLATRTFSDGSVIYFVTIADVSDNDQGKYICKAFDFSKLTYFEEDSIDIKIYSYPARIYPLCSSIPNQPVTVSVDDTLSLKCTSEKSFPPILTKWMNTKTARYIATRNETKGNLVHTESSILVDNSLQGTVFSCEITSTGFPDWKRTCAVGPITVNSYLVDNQRSEIFRKADFGDDLNIDNSGNIPKLQHNGNCVECSTDDMLQVYLTIAIAGTGFLAIIFLASTIILCYKYHNISTVTMREPSRVLTPQQSIEPVYVSCQRRSVNADREYMTLEDPNNPDNKIILPKETFDDYCRTMTLKRV